MIREDIIKELIIKDFENIDTQSSIYDREGFRYVIGSVIYDLYTKNGNKVISYRNLRKLEDDYYINLMNFLTAYNNDEFGSNASSKAKKTLKRTVKFYNKKKRMEQKMLEKFSMGF